MQTVPTPADAPEPTRVLMIDDDVELTELLAEYLRREGFQVDVAHDGETGAELARSWRWRANMPSPSSM